MAGKLEDRVKDIIVEQLGVNAEQVTSEASFIDDLGADSLDSVELIMAFEEEFGAAIPEEDAEKLTTVGKVVEYLKSKGYGFIEESRVVDDKGTVKAIYLDKEFGGFAVHLVLNK